MSEQKYYLKVSYQDSVLEASAGFKSEVEELIEFGISKIADIRQARQA